MKRNKIISILLAMVVVLSCFAFSFSAFGKTQKLFLNVKYIDKIDGADDLLWYTYTPEASGTYSFLSYNVPQSQGFLFIRPTDENGNRVYKQLAYSNQDPNYKENEHNSLQFCVTYHLDKGTTYYFAAGYYLSSRVDGNMTVMLRCDEYDSEVIDHLEVSCPAHLTWFTDGQWKIDADKKSYYYYNTSKIIQNMTVSLVYKDGSKKSVTGQDTIEDYQISYKNNQSTDHWYSVDDEKYNGNILTVSVLNLSVDYNVVIDTNELFAVTGNVYDYTDKNSIKDAKIYLGTSPVATTDNDGNFNFVTASGSYNLSVTYPNAVTHKYKLDIGKSNSSSVTNLDLPLILGDYQNDNVINAKDYAYIIKNLESDEKDIQLAKFAKQINYSQKTYDKDIDKQ